MSIKGFEVGGVQQQYDYTALDNIPANLVQDANYVHTDNNYTNADKTKLSGIEAQANKTTIDATLTHSGQAADAKATGDAISALNAQVIASMPHDTASGPIASFPDGAAMPVRDLSVDIEPVQAGSGDPSPDNVRPISGWTGVNVYRTGKNLFGYSLPIHKGYWSETSFVGNDSVLTLENATGWTNLRVPVPEGATITISGMQAKSGVYSAWLGSDDPTDVVSRFFNYSINGTMTVPSGAKYLGVCFSELNTAYADYPNAQIELGSTATVYESYQGNTYPISWQNEAGTVYGGMLDVLTGVLTVLYARYKFTGTESNYVQATSNRVAIKTNIVWKSSQTGWCTDFDFLSTGATNFIYLTTTMPAADVKTYMGNHDVYAVCELATPIEVDLTPTEITTLLGTNNIFADCGDTTVNYYADPTLFVNKKIAAAVAALS